MGSKAWDAVVVEHRRRQVLRIGEAAAELVTRDGLGEVSMTRLARTLGMSRATLYNYVPDVATAIRTYLDAQADAFHTAVAAAVAEEGSAEAQLRRYVHEQVAYVACTDHRAAVALAEAGAALGGTESAAAHQRRHSATLEAILDRGVREGVFRPSAGRVRIVLITRLLYGAHELLHQQHMTVEEVAAAITELVLNGVQPGLAGVQGGKQRTPHHQSASEQER